MYTKMTYTQAEGTLKSTICTIMLGHYDTFLPNVAYMLDHDSDEDYDLEWERHTFDASVSTIGGTPEEILRCLRCISHNYIRGPCIGNGFKFGIVGHVIRDRAKVVVVRSGTTYEDRTRWVMSKNVANSEGKRNAGSAGSSSGRSGLPPMSGGGRRGGGSGGVSSQAVSQHKSVWSRSTVADSVW